MQTSRGKLTISMDFDVLGDCKIRAARLDKSISDYIQNLIIQDIKSEPVIQYEILNKTKKLKRKKGAAGNGSSSDDEQT